MPAIHQFIPTYEPSAVGSHTFQVQVTLRKLGIDSEIFSRFVHPGMPGDAHDVADYGRASRARPDDVLLYQFAIGNDMVDDLRGRPETIAVNYHNVTPASFWWDWEPDVARGLEWGRAQLAEFATTPTRTIAVSKFNARELASLGYQSIGVAPVLFDPGEFESPSDATTDSVLADQRRRGGPNLLFVGSVAPHKCQHDIIKMFAVYSRCYSPDARLYLVGAATSPSYLTALEAFITRLGLEDSVHITGSVSHASLVSYYRSADVFVCLSEHEGFCVPLLESWHHRVPVVAFSSSAVPETLGDAGLLLPSKGAGEVAAAVNRCVVDSGLRGELTARGERRSSEFALDRSRERFVAALGPLVEGVR